MVNMQYSDNNKNQVIINNGTGETKLIRQFLDIIYPNATIDGYKVKFIKRRRKYSVEITEVIYDLNISGLNATYNKLKSMIEVV